MLERVKFKNRQVKVVHNKHRYQELVVRLLKTKDSSITSATCLQEAIQIINILLIARKSIV